MCRYLTAQVIQGTLPLIKMCFLCYHSQIFHHIFGQDIQQDLLTEDWLNK